jgi:hypothetical protein
MRYAHYWHSAVTVKCRTAIKTMLLYLTLCLSVKLDSPWFYLHSCTNTIVDKTLRRKLKLKQHETYTKQDTMGQFHVADLLQFDRKKNRHITTYLTITCICFDQISKHAIKPWDWCKHGTFWLWWSSLWHYRVTSYRQICGDMSILFTIKL